MNMPQNTTLNMLVTSSAGATTFPRFKELATELQIQIWKYVIENEDKLDVRSFPVKFLIRRPADSPYGVGGKHQRFTGPTSKIIVYYFGKPSATLEVCGLARLLTLRDLKERVMAAGKNYKFKGTAGRLKFVKEVLVEMQKELEVRLQPLLEEAKKADAGRKTRAKAGKKVKVVQKGKDGKNGGGRKTEGGKTMSNRRMTLRK